MPFLDTAREYVRAKAREIDDSLKEETYVPRFLLKEGAQNAEVKAAYWRYHRAEGEWPPGDGDFLRDDDLLQLPRVFVIGNAGSGKTYVLRHVFCLAADRLVADDNAPVPLWLDLASDLPHDLDLQEALRHRTDGLWDELKSMSASCLLFLDGLDELLVRRYGSSPESAVKVDGHG